MFCGDRIIVWRFVEKIRWRWLLTGCDHVEHARFHLLSCGVWSPASDRSVIVVPDAVAAATSNHAVHWRAVVEHRRQFAVLSGTPAGPTSASGLAGTLLSVLHQLVAAHLGCHPVRPIERPFELVRCRVRVYLAHNFRVLVSGHAVGKLLVVFAHRFICNHYIG